MGLSWLDRSLDSNVAIKLDESVPIPRFQCFATVWLCLFTIFEIWGFVCVYRVARLARVLIFVAFGGFVGPRQTHMLVGAQRD